MEQLWLKITNKAGDIELSWEKIPENILIFFYEFQYVLKIYHGSFFDDALKHLEIFVSLHKPLSFLKEHLEDFLAYFVEIKEGEVLQAKNRWDYLIQAQKMRERSEELEPKIHKIYGSYQGAPTNRFMWKKEDQTESDWWKQVYQFQREWLVKKMPLIKVNSHLNKWLDGGEYVEGDIIPHNESWWTRGKIGNCIVFYMINHKIGEIKKIFND